MTEVQRAAVCTTLKDVGGFSDFKDLELAIFTMCKELAEEYDDDFEAIYCKFAFEKTGQLINSKESRSEILEDIAQKNLEWNSAVFAKYREREEQDNTDQAAGVKVAKGEFICKNSRCRSNETCYSQVQSRSADEPPTTHVVCTKCGYRYAFN